MALRQLRPRPSLRAGDGSNNNNNADPSPGPEARPVQPSPKDNPTRTATRLGAIPIQAKAATLKRKRPEKASPPALQRPENYAYCPRCDAPVWQGKDEKVMQQHFHTAECRKGLARREAWGRDGQKAAQVEAPAPTSKRTKTYMVDAVRLPLPPPEFFDTPHPWICPTAPAKQAIQRAPEPIAESGACERRHIQIIEVTVPARAPPQIPDAPRRKLAASTPAAPAYISRAQCDALLAWSAGRPPTRAPCPVPGCAAQPVGKHLAEHLVSHIVREERIKYACPRCGREYLTPIGLTLHVDRVHPMSDQ